MVSRRYEVKFSTWPFRLHVLCSENCDPEEKRAVAEDLVQSNRCCLDIFAAGVRLRFATVQQLLSPEAAATFKVTFANVRLSTDLSERMNAEITAAKPSRGNTRDFSHFSRESLLKQARIVHMQRGGEDPLRPVGLRAALDWIVRLLVCVEGGLWSCRSGSVLSSELWGAFPSRPALLIACSSACLLGAPTRIQIPVLFSIGQESCGVPCTGLLRQAIVTTGMAQSGEPNRATEHCRRSPSPTQPRAPMWVVQGSASWSKRRSSRWRGPRRPSARRGKSSCNRGRASAATATCMPIALISKKFKMFKMSGGRAI